jgi:hypothetical protein
MRDLFEEHGGDAFQPGPEHAYLAPLAALPEHATSSAAGGACSEGCTSEPAAGGALPGAVLGKGDSANDGGAVPRLGEALGMWRSLDWLEVNPLGVPTEREMLTLQEKGGRVYRCMLVRK